MAHKIKLNEPYQRKVNHKSSPKKKSRNKYLMVVVLASVFLYVKFTSKQSAITEIQDKKPLKKELGKTYRINKIKNDATKSREYIQKSVSLLATKHKNSSASFSTKKPELKEDRFSNASSANGDKKFKKIAKYSMLISREDYQTKNQNIADHKQRYFKRILKNPASLEVRRDETWTKESSYPIANNGTRKFLRDESMPVILVWWPPTHLHQTKESSLERIFQGVCGKCRLTTNRSTLNQSSVIIFDNVPDKVHLNDLPSPHTRRKEQSYILWQRKAAGKTIRMRKNMPGTFDKMFNYTLSYRRDADITWYFGNTVYTKRSMPVAAREYSHHYVQDIMSLKQHLAVWIVDNCNGTYGAVNRMKYAKELEKQGLEIDFYGKCFQKETVAVDSTDLLRRYKFYLAFEDFWHCKDYLTEIFWRNALMSNVVPIVWGPSPQDVAAVAPHHSFIHVEDYNSPRELIRYLQYLDKNEIAYLEYFNWRKQAIPVNIPIQMLRPGFESPMCKICRILVENEGKMPHKILSSSIDWLFGNINANNTCLKLV